MEIAILDWLCYVPALLVCVRAVFDETFRLRWPKSATMLGLLGVWAVASVFWSADRFAAAVSAGKLVAGAAVLWTLVQLVRDWRAFRIVLASLAGLVAVLFVHCLMYRLYDIPEMQKTVEQNAAQIAAEHGFAPGSFQAKQFLQKAVAGELMGFCVSPNSLAAMMVMLSLVLVGDLIQRKRDGRAPIGWVGHVLLLAAAGWVIMGARSRTAAATPVLGIILIVVGWNMRSWLAAHRGKALAGGVALLTLFWGAVIGHGLWHGTLFHRSLTFRWHYWTASMHLLRDHLLKGVGWENFGDSYLQYRLPVAPEEVHDPHNLFLRFATELGLIGLALALGWLGATAWELTRPARKRQEEAPLPIMQDPVRAIAPLMWVAGIVTMLVIAAEVDTSQDPMYWLVQQAMRKMLYGVAFMGVAGWIAVADLQKPRLDDSRAPWALLGACVGLLMFLVHGFIDFAMFEDGPWYVMVLIAGSVIGVRAALAEGDETGEVSARGGILGGLGIGAVWAAMGIMVVAPVVLGEGAAARGDAAVAASNFPAADEAFGQAYGNSMWLRNYAYLVREEHAQWNGNAPPDRTAATMTAAVDANPLAIRPHLDLAQLYLRVAQPEAALPHLQRVVELNPTDIDFRRQLGDVLAMRGRGPEAIAQYAKALWLNSQFPADEPKRLPDADIAEIKGKIRSLGGTAEG
jgi:O-antigen ligase